MNIEMHDITIGTTSPPAPTELSKNDLIWQALTSCQISMALNKLLHLLPRFQETVVSMTSSKERPSALLHLAESNEGPVVMDA